MVSIAQFSNKQWIYQLRPEGRVSSEHYRLDESLMDAVVAKNECIVEMKYISVDPCTFVRLNRDIFSSFMI
jgi:NADPH-dependent curcumin reductase CurA